MKKFLLALLVLFLAGCNSTPAPPSDGGGATQEKGYQELAASRQSEVEAVWSSLNDIFEGDDIDIFASLEDKLKGSAEGIQSLTPPEEAKEAHDKLVKMLELTEKRLAAQKKMHQMQLDSQEPTPEMQEELEALTQEYEALMSGTSAAEPAPAAEEGESPSEE